MRLMKRKILSLRMQSSKRMKERSQNFPRQEKRTVQSKLWFVFAHFSRERSLRRKEKKRAMLRSATLSACQANKPNSKSSSSIKFSLRRQHRKMFLNQSSHSWTALSRDLRPASSRTDRRGQVNRTPCRAAQKKKMGWYNKLLST